MVLATACGDGGLCDPAELAAALANAAPGDTVSAGSCRLDGSFDVPSGVTLEGSGILATTFVAPIDRAAINLLPGASVATFTDASVETGGVVGVLARGDGEAHVARVNINVTAGIGAGFQDLRALAIEDLIVEGTVTRENAGLLGRHGSRSGSTFGLVAVDVADATFARIAVRGFSEYGVFVLRGASAWSDSSSSRTRGINTLFYGGTHTLDHYTSGDGIRGVDGFPAYGLTATIATITANTLDVSDVDDVGILLGNLSATLTGVNAAHNLTFGVAMDHTHDVEISGAFDDNGIAAVAAIDSANIRVHDTAISNTRLLLRAEGAGSFLSGDGLQFVRSPIGARIEGVTLSNNARVGALFELDGAALEATTFSNVTVTTTVASSLGVVVQNGTRPANWDASITRNGSSSSTADLLAGPLGSVQGVGPCWMPPPDVQTMGVQAIIGY